MIYYYITNYCRIQESNYDGTCLIIIAKIGGNKPYDMYLAGNSLIWSNIANSSNEYLAFTNIVTGVTTYKNVSSQLYAVGMINDKSLSKYLFFSQLCFLEIHFFIYYNFRYTTGQGRINCSF